LVGSGRIWSQRKQKAENGKWEFGLGRLPGVKTRAPVRRADFTGDFEHSTRAVRRAVRGQPRVFRGMSEPHG